jgi:Uma2 family endonuclease
MTWEEFLVWVDEEHRAEWVDGEVEFMSPASLRHQDLGSFLTTLIRHYVESGSLGVVLPTPFLMKTGVHLPGREPDILFVAEQNRTRLTNTYLNGPADLAVEIVSPESVQRDRGNKYREYEQGGVREFWLLDQDEDTYRFYRLDAEGHFVPILPDEEGIVRSMVLEGLWLNVEWLRSKPLPPLMSVLRAWGLV